MVRLDDQFRDTKSRCPQKGVKKVKGWRWSEVATVKLPLASSTAGKITGSPQGTETQTGERREVHKG